MRIVFMGTPQAAVPSLDRILNDGHEVAAVYTQPDKPSGRGNKIALSPVKKLALLHDLPIYQPAKIRTPEALQEFISHEGDGVVVVAFGRILPESFLQVFPKGAINVHFSLLPKYRGAAPVNWTIANGENRTGVTTMQMDAGLDTGDILLQRETWIEPEETSIDLMERLSFTGADLLSETLAMYDELVPEPQNNEEATLAPIMKREDGFIDWENTAARLSDRVRGFQPFPTAFTFYEAQKLTIWKGKPVPGFVSHVSRVGEILEAKGDSLLVLCGSGTVLGIEELQLEGKRRMSTRDFLNGASIQIGEKLGRS